MQKGGESGEGEAVTIIRPGYRIDCVRPCGEEGKKVAEARVMLRAKTGEMLGSLEREFQKVERFPKLNLVRFEFEGMSILLYDNGDLRIRKIRDVAEAVRAAERIVSVLRGG
jgi:ArsR family metal-binding transcriptional regulator